jgi:hypothetical protein
MRETTTIAVVGTQFTSATRNGKPDMAKHSVEAEKEEWKRQTSCEEI